MKHYIGIDISADEFHYCISSADKGNKIESSCENNPIAIARFIKRSIGPNDVCIMESTGVYHHELAFALDEAGIRQYVVNPKTLSNYRSLFGGIAKTDRKDAQVLVRFLQANEHLLKPYKIPSTKEVYLRVILNDLGETKKSLLRYQNRLHSRERSFGKRHLNSILRKVNFYKAELKRLEKELKELMKADFKEDMELLESIPGFGTLVSSWMIILYRSFKDSLHLYDGNMAKAFASYIGVVPTIYQSGKKKPIYRLKRSSCPAFRSILYMGMRSATYTTKKTNVFSRMKERFKEPNPLMPAKKINIAICHKAVKIACAILESRKPYQDNFQSKHPYAQFSA
jgi:transposase